MGAFAFAALAAGLLGGVHCAGMCGGIVASLSAAARGPPLPRQLAFNAGRIASYSLAGAIAGGVGTLLQAIVPIAGVQLVLFISANVMLLLLGLYVAGWGRAVLRLEAAGGAVWRRIEPLRRHFFPIDSTARALGAGAVWGWVPCGLVYSLLTLALASGDAVSGAAVMAMFGLGTLPALLAAGLAAQRLLAVRRLPWVRQAAGAIMISLAILGFARLPGLDAALHTAWLCFS